MSLAQLQAKMDSYGQSLKTVFDLYTSGQEAQGRTVIAGVAAQSAIDDLVQTEMGQVQQTTAVNQDLIGFLSLVMVGVTVIAFLLSFGLSQFLVKMVRRPLKTAGRAVETIARGNLVPIIDPKALRSPDEFGQLLRGLESMRGDLALAIEKIDATSNHLGEVGAQLDRALGDANSAVRSIGGTVADVQALVRGQALSAVETSSTIDQIVSSIEGLRQDIEANAAAVSRSSSAVQQMMANTVAVTRSVERMAEEFENLVRASDAEKGRLATVAERVRVVSNQSQKLLEANGTINDIAAQTNLLAMNAAIEAAHAGSR